VRNKKKKEKRVKQKSYLSKVEVVVSGRNQHGSQEKLKPTTRKGESKILMRKSADKKETLIA
jgi:hypothetical protein